VLKKPQAHYLIPNCVLIGPFPDPIASQLKFHCFLKIHFNSILKSQYLSSKRYISFLICLLQLFSIALRSSVLFTLKQSDVFRSHEIEPSIPWNIIYHSLRSLASLHIYRPSPVIATSEPWRGLLYVTGLGSNINEPKRWLTKLEERRALGRHWAEDRILIQ